MSSTILTTLSKLVEKLSERLDRYANVLDRFSLTLDKVANKQVDLVKQGQIAVAKLEDDAATFREDSLSVAKAVGTELSKLRDEASRAWTLNASREQLHTLNESKLNEKLDTVLGAMQKFNERLGQVESKVLNYGSDVVRLTDFVNKSRVVNPSIEGSTNMLSECVAAHHARITTLEDQAGFAKVAARDNAKVINTYVERTKVLEEKLKVDLRKALPTFLTLVLDPSFRERMNASGYEVDTKAIVSMVQELVNEPKSA